LLTKGGNRPKSPFEGGLKPFEGNMFAQYMMSTVGVAGDEGGQFAALIRDAVRGVPIGMLTGPIISYR
jgi:hypothetical protein